ncbi:MAG: GNAT family N-acetyltransferase [Chloroflexi bacterium]|nr:GNAT family N-acetyltransferase [Chloroflexota bacterium]
MTISHPRLLTLADVEQAAQVIAQAFAETPFMMHMYPLKRTRLTTLVKFFRIYAEKAISHNRGFGLGEPLQGAAFWKFPEQPPLSPGRRSWRKFLPLLLTAYPIGYLRTRSIMKRIRALHVKHAASEPHFYLDYVGVIPSARGQGLSSALIRPFLRLADERKVFTYLETMNKVNLTLYEHFGFHCVEQSPVHGTDITVYAFKRPFRSR